MENGVKDQIEQFNWQRDMETQRFPSTMQPFLPETKEFCRKTHEDVMFKVLRCRFHTAVACSSVPVFALALQIPSETFVDMHRYAEKDDAWFRCE